jgi:hypothetical protein
MLQVTAWEQMEAGLKQKNARQKNTDQSARSMIFLPDIFLLFWAPEPVIGVAKSR